MASAYLRLFFSMTVNEFRELIVETENRCGEHEELGTHHEHARGDVMVRADYQRRERQAYSGQE